MTHSISASAHSFSLRAVSRRWTLGAALALTAAFRDEESDRWTTWLTHFGVNPETVKAAL